ncbi:MAG TPA: biopolymer transporter ExbD [Candidatus Krumholzibacteria bacterium]|nr:biopolymer transporter ExbD [Candidatus Krumholzibacteria bacterium]
MGVLAKRKKKRDGGEIPMASTSDVAFLLLIFFIVMPMKADEIGISLVLPGKSNNKTDTAKVSQKNVAVIRVTANNAILFDEQPVRLGDLEARIRERVEANDKTVVILETHPDANYGMMVACLDEVKLSGARKFSLKTTKL